MHTCAPGPCDSAANPGALLRCHTPITSSPANERGINGFDFVEERGFTHRRRARRGNVIHVFLLKVFPEVVEGGELRRGTRGTGAECKG